jgi:hypothetical protein
MTGMFVNSKESLALASSTLPLRWLEEILHKIFFNFSPKFLITETPITGEIYIIRD